MKRKIFLSFLGLSTFGMLLAACNGGRGNVDPSQDIPDLDIAKKVVDYTAGTGKDKVFASSGYGNGDPFNVTWNAANVYEGEKELKMKITDAPEGNEYPYYGGELRSLEFFGYGDFGVRMKPAKTTGTASTFFLYTGEWDSETLHPSTGETDTKNPKNAEGKHDEIDIEFLGKDTTKVQFNYFTSGQGGHEYMYDLGFDASLEYHDYGFRWEEGKITWFVDNKAVYTATSNIPTHPGRMISNFWTGSDAARMWMGALDKENLHEATYQWFSSSVKGEESHKEPEPGPGPEPGEVIDWSIIDPVDLTDVQGNTDTYSYELSEDNKSMEITYENVGQNYNNLNVAIPSGAADCRILSFQVENKGTAAVAVRGNANSANTHGEHNIYAVNSSARQDGQAVTTDLEWGGSMFNIQPGQTSLCEITYSEAISRLEWMIDSHVAGEQSGNIVIKNLKFSGAEIDPEPTPEPTPAPEPVAPADVTDAQAVEFKDIQGNVGSGSTYQYALSADKKAMNVVYQNVSQNYNNVNVAVPTGAADSRTLSFKVTNNGDAPVAVRGNANGTTPHGEHSIVAVNVSAKQDGVDVSTDLEWGGSFFNIAAGATSVCEITYSETIARLEWMIDSHIAGSQSGDVIISTLKFDGYDPSVTPEPEPTPTPAPTPTKPSDVTDEDAIAFTDIQGNVGSESTYQYLLSDDTKAMNVVYQDVTQNYNNVNVAIPSAVSESRTLSFKVTNNGETAVAVRGNANADTTHGAHDIKAVNVSAKQDGVAVSTDLEWGGSFFTIAAGATSVCEITYSEAISRLEWMIDSHIAGTQSGDVTISTLKFAEPEPEPAVTTLNFVSKAPYTAVVDTENGKTTISYESVETDTYANISAAITGAPVGPKAISFDLKNTGANNSTVAFDLLDSDGHHICVVRDYDYFDFNGGNNRAQFGIDAGATRKLVIAYVGELARIDLYYDSLWNNESHTEHTNGSLEISNVEYVDHSVITLNFSSQNGYTCTSANGTTNIVYEGGAEAAYQNVWFSLEGIAPTGKNTLAFNVTNNATDHQAKFMVQLGGITGDTFIDVPASSTVRQVINLGENTPTSICVFIDSISGGTIPAGNVTISNVWFYNVA